MKVVFLENVEGTAQVGDVKEVKNGFARNFLLPKGLAAPAVEPYMARAQSGAKREAKRQEALDQESAALAARLEGQRITMTARVGEQGKLYGSITAVHISQEVAQLLGAEEFDHRKVLLSEAIKETGTQAVRLRLTRNIEASIEIEVLAEGAEEEVVPVELEGSDTEKPLASSESGVSDSEDSPESADSDSPDSEDSPDSPE